MSKRSSFRGHDAGTSLRIGAALCLASSLWAGDAIKESLPGSGHKPAPSLDRPGSTSINRLPTGTSLGSGIAPNTLPDAPVLTPGNNSKTDPELLRRFRIQADKSRNWLLENAASLGAKPKQGSAREVDPVQDGSPESLSKASLDRIRRATQRPGDKTAGTRNSTDPNSDSVSNERKEKRAEDLESDEDLDKVDARPKVAVAFGGVLKAAERPLFGASRTERELFTAPEHSIAEDRSRDSVQERNDAFDHLLGGIGAGVSGTIDLSKAPATRAQKFDSLLAGNAAASRPTAFAPPLSTAAAGPGGGFPGAFERSSPLLSPTLAPSTLRAAPPKFQPRPVFLQIPTRGL